MDLILSLPVWRFSVMAVPAVVATVGAAVLAASVWLGLALGLLCVRFPNPPSLGRFLPGAQLLRDDLLFHRNHHVHIVVEPRSLANDLAGRRFLHRVVDPEVHRADVACRKMAWPPLVPESLRAQELILSPPKGIWPGLHYDVTLILIGLCSYAIAAACSRGAASPRRGDVILHGDSVSHHESSKVRNHETRFRLLLQ